VGKSWALVGPKGKFVAIEFTCSSCKKRLRCPDSAAGTKARCPQCNEINNVPLFSDPPALNPSGEMTPTAQASSPIEMGLGPVPASPPPFQPAVKPASETTTQSASASPPNFAPPPFSAPSSSTYPSPPVSPPAWGPAPGVNEFSDAGKANPAMNPYSAPGAAGMPPQPADQSGLASSLGVVSIVVGSVSLVLGFCCCPVSVVSSLTALGLGIWGMIAANNQLNQVRHAPYLRHLEPPAKTAHLLCVIGVVISSISSVIYAGLLILSFVS
jgi:hypothetical protein